MDGCRVIDLNYFINSLMAATVCNKCKAHQMKITEEVVTSITSTFLLTCPCGATLRISTSKKLISEGANPSRCAFELNRRLVFAFRTIDLGFTAMQLFTVAMNMPFTMSKHTYQSHVTSIRAAALTVAEGSMQQAAADLHATNDATSEVCDGVSCDGTWQRRGFSSLTGVVPVISHRNGKVLDFVVLTKYCKECEYWSHKDHESTQYHKWHRCKANYTGSSASMESSGAVQLWSRTGEKRKIRYTKMIADGDSKSHTQVNESKPYGDVEIEKLVTLKKEWVLVSVD